MAIDPGLADLLRDALMDEDIHERRMFGGLVMMRNGHMLCGLRSDGAMFRVGHGGMAAALALAGVRVWRNGGLVMGGFVDIPSEDLEDEAVIGKVLELALDFVKSLPPK